MERDREFNEQSKIGKKEEKKNRLQEELEQIREQKVQWYIQEFVKRGYKKLGKYKINDLEKGIALIDYDEASQAYNEIKKKEMETFEQNKNKKAKTVEHWARALREEERKALIEYCKARGEDDI